MLQRIELGILYSIVRFDPGSWEWEEIALFPLPGCLPILARRNA
jgi:hypothetical protein